ncbi:MAG: S41 family peptidase [Candidatus Eremiobacteraeota bacterium]|nr:S41 family peptidase [Candidatus Eremiobacteraeota bacterium]
MNKWLHNMATVLLITACCLTMALCPAYGQNHLTFDDVLAVMETTKSEFYRPIDGKDLVAPFLKGMREAAVNMGFDDLLSGIAVTGTIKNDVSAIKAALENAQLSPRAMNHILIHGLSTMLSSLGDEGTKIERPERHYISLKEMGYDKGGAGFFLDDKKDEMGRFPVIETLPGFSAEKSGVQTGDRIERIDYYPVKDLTYKQIADLIRGPIGTEVSITFSRPGEKKPRTIKISRKWLAPNFKSIDTELMEGSILYIRVKFLGENLPIELSEVLKQHEAKGAKKVILDLRSNGGTMEGAVELAGSYLPKGTILYSKVNRKVKEVFRSLGEPQKTFPMAILLNEKSGSPSILVGGILQDYQKALIVGAQPEWHETVDETHTLPNGCYYTVTTGYYILPKGRTLINANGIKPDFTVSQSPLVRYRHGEDRQLQKALEVLKKN